MNFISDNCSLMYKKVSANFPQKKIMYKGPVIFWKWQYWCMCDACMTKIAYFWNWTPDQQNYVHFKIKKKYKITPPYPTTIWHNLENFGFLFSKSLHPTVLHTHSLNFLGRGKWYWFLCATCWRATCQLRETKIKINNCLITINLFMFKQKKLAQKAQHFYFLKYFCVDLLFTASSHFSC